MLILNFFDLVRSCIDMHHGNAFCLTPDCVIKLPWDTPYTFSNSHSVVNSNLHRVYLERGKPRINLPF